MLAIKGLRDVRDECLEPVRYSSTSMIQPVINNRTIYDSHVGSLELSISDDKIPVAGCIIW